MSKTPFITQEDSPNIIIVPTLSFCGPPQKTTKIDSEKVQTTPCVQTLSLSKNSESSSESMTENSNTNTSAESSDSKSGDSSQSLPRVNEAARPKPSSSWASNYLMSIGDSHGPIKLNLSPFRKKIEAPKESVSQNKSAHYEKLPPTEIKKAIPSEESRGPSRITSGSSISKSKDILTKNVHAENLSSLPKTNFTSDETNTKKKMKRVSEHEAQTSAKKSKISSEMIGTNQCLYKATESHTGHGDKIKAPVTSKYIPTPDKCKYNKYNQISTGHKKPTKDGVNKPSYPCNSSCCTAKNIRDKIKTSQNKIVKTSKQKYVKSTVTKKSSPIKQPYYSTDYLKSYKNYDIQTIKCKEFYNKYKIPKISDRKKKIRENESAEVTENDINKNRISDIFGKELGEAACSTPIKSVVKVADDSDRKEVNKAFDLRSKLSCRSLNHHFTMLRNLSEPERQHTEPIEDRESLLITLPNDTDVKAEPTTKRKLDDGNISKKKYNIKTPIEKELKSPKIKEAYKSPKIKEVKSPSSKFKKIKLVINVICEKSGTSSSESEDEESVENSDTEKKDIIPNLDLSFLDDFNIDEIIESLGGKEKCELPSYELKDNTADDFNAKPDVDHINDIDVTKNIVYSALVTDSENDRSLLMKKHIKTEECTNERDVFQSSNNIEQLECKNALKTSLNDLAQKHVLNSKDEVLHTSSYTLPITDIHNSASDTKQQKNSESRDVLSLNEYLKSEKEGNAPLVISKTIDTLKTDNEGALGNEIKHRNVLPVVLETDKLSAGINNTREALTDINSLQETNNNTAKSDVRSLNVRLSDVPSENDSEDIPAILKFLQTNDTPSSKFCKNSSSTKDIYISNKMPEVNNTNNFGTVHSSINIASKPVLMEKANIEMVIATTKDTKKEEKNETQANNDTACNDSAKKNTKQDNYETDIATNIKVLDYKGANQEKLAREVSETNQRIDEINEPTKLINKARTENYDETEKQTNHVGKKDEENDIQQNVDSNQDILHKTNKEEIENNSTIEESNKDANDNVKTKLEATQQSDPLLKTPRLVEKTKVYNTDSQNKKKNELNISEISIDLTDESDETPEIVQGNCVANDRKSVTKTIKRNSQVVKNCFTNDDVLDISTDVETKYIEKNETQANNDTACNDSAKKNTKQDNYETDIATNIKVLDYKGGNQEKLAREVSETNQRIDEINEPTKLINKARTENYDETEKQTNHVGKKDEENDIQQNVDSIQDILHKTNKEEIENNSTIEESNKDANDNVETKLEATQQSDPLLKTPRLVEKTKGHNTDSQNKKKNELNISEISIDLTDESDETPEIVQGNCIANDRKSVTKTTKRNSQVVKNCFTNDDVLDISTDVETKYIDYSLNPTTYLTDITIDLTQESNDNPDTANLVKNFCAKATDAIDDECGNNKESVTNTTKGSAIEVQENYVNVTNDDIFATKTTAESAKKCDENCATEASGTKTKEHKNLSPSENTSQSSVINKTDTVSEDKTKDKPEVTEDFLQMDASLAKKITDKIQQWSKKKHTIKSLIHYGQFSKIYECVNECGDKYAVKIMHGNIVKYSYRFSKTESIMKRLQRDVPNENYHCVYLFQGLGSTTNWCLLMELYPKNLKQALQENEKSFHINLIQDLSRQLVSAVTLLRNKNIVHTNINPTHILLNSTNNQLKLCGFDEAQYVGGIQFTRDVEAINYRAPEIILGHSAGFQMDVWSTALVMYEMATNIQLFPGEVHNDILYKQMFVCGPVPYDMLKASKFKNEHFSGFSFLRQKKDGNFSKIPCHIMRKHDLIKKYVYLTYKQDWHRVTSYKQKQMDYAKLQDFCRLLHKMLTMDPKQRVPIEFVFADPFIYKATTDNSLLKPSAKKIFPSEAW